MTVKRPSWIYWPLPDFRFSTAYTYATAIAIRTMSHLTRVPIFVMKTSRRVPCMDQEKVNLSKPLISFLILLLSYIFLLLYGVLCVLILLCFWFHWCCFVNPDCNCTIHWWYAVNPDCNCMIHWWSAVNPECNCMIHWWYAVNPDCNCMIHWRYVVNPDCNCMIYWWYAVNKGNNKIAELRTILQRESQNS